MNLSQEKQEILERFLQGKLSPADQVTFDQYSQDPDFQKELAVWQEMQPVFGVHGRNRLKKRLQQTEKSLTAKGPKRRTLGQYFAIAATILLLISLFFFLPGKKDGKDLYASYFQPYGNSVINLTRGSANTTDLATAFRAYESGDFALAGDLLASLPQNDTLKFYRAVSLMHEGDFAGAESLFKIISFAEEASFFQGNEWYQALTYLAQNKIQEAKLILQRIADDSAHSYQGEAAELVQKLK